MKRINDDVSAEGVLFVLDDQREPVRIKSRLVIGMDRDRPSMSAFIIESPGPMPNAWMRFWHWFLLGWRWEKVGIERTGDGETTET